MSDLEAYRCERIGDCVLYLGDMKAIVAALPEVNHVISDPPYEDELHKAVGRIRRKDGQEMIETLGFDGINADRAAIAKLLTEKSKGWAILFCLAEGVRAWRDDLQSAGAKWDTVLAWIKPDASPRFNGQGAARGFECAVTVWCGKGYRKWNGGGRRGVFTHCVNTSRETKHPTEKPLALMSELVGLYTQFGDTVLDPFMGSGTTGIAAITLGRKFIGIEQNEAHFEEACERVRTFYSQPSLFAPQPKTIHIQQTLFAETT